MYKNWRIGILVLVAFALALSVTTGCPANKDQTVKSSKSEQPKGDQPKGDQPKDHPHKD